MDPTGKEFASVVACAVGVAIGLAGLYVVTQEARDLYEKAKKKGAEHDRTKTR